MKLFRRPWLYIAAALLLAGLALAMLERDFRGELRDSSGTVSGDSAEIAFVANVVDGTVSLLELDTLRVIRTLNVIPDGRRVGPGRSVSQWLAQGILEDRGGLNFAQDTDVSRDGRVLFVSRGYLGDVAAFDLATGDMLWRTTVPGFRADHMALAPDGRHLYLSALIYAGNQVYKLATDSGDRVGSFSAGQWPHDVHSSADGKRIYAASLGNMLTDRDSRGTDSDAYRIVVADADSLEVQRFFSFEAGVRPFAVTRDETRLFAQLSNSHDVIARNLGDSGGQQRLELPIAEGVSEADWDFEAPHHGLALTPDETQLCIAGRASDYAAIVGTQPLEAQHIVPVGDAPSWATLDAKGERCLLANTRSDDVSIVSMRDGSEIARVPTGRAPKHITVARIPRCVVSGDCR